MYQGKYHIYDTKISISVDVKGGIYGEWEKQFIKNLMNPIADLLKQLNFKLQKQDYIFNYPQNKYGRKGDLRLDLKQMGRSIDLEFFQNVNAPNRPDHGGRHEFNKMELMPYLMKKEVLRVFNHVIRYLTENTQIVASEKRKTRASVGPGFGQITVEEWMAIHAGQHDNGLHYEYNCTSADKQVLASGDRVYFYDRKGRIRTGIARYNINNMWWVITGKYNFTNEGGSDLYKTCPGDVRIKENKGSRKRKLSQMKFNCEMQGNLKRAAQIKTILDREYGDIGLLVTRDQARAYFEKCGLKYNQITRYQFDQLRKRLNDKMIASKLFEETYQVNRKTRFSRKEAYIGCKAHYFGDREAIQFNRGGYIGFAGWADNYAVKPILEAFIEWCDYVKKSIARRGKLLSHV